MGSHEIIERILNGFQDLNNQLVESIKLDREKMNKMPESGNKQILRDSIEKSETIQSLVGLLKITIDEKNELKEENKRLRLGKK